MVVDGERFEVTEPAGEPGVDDLLRVSGPHEGYGFTSSTYGGDVQTDAVLEDAVRNFLSQVDRRTGYID
ncbi:hypothetical protein KMZ32_11140 [Phycicoccus sp. MAQZ13P-2]|nr:hypothetical protein [Phycicoccus mangrovi]MBT9257819.1 hypothetical protein [Phycicoccus mangrovi]MBT9274625.1 hypothetical protein [Phycicoccus mangrovi]